MKIVHISDTHGLHNAINDMPDGDVLVHSGDFTMAGTEREVRDFIGWFLLLPYGRKVLVAGNHDKCLCGRGLEGLPDNCHFLYNAGVEIDGLLFYGTPMFRAERESGLQDANIAKIPDGVGVLVTHQPPYKIMDCDGKRHYGSKALLSRVKDAKPRLHLFGHVHSGYGIEKSDATVFCNSSLVSDDYRLCNRPRVIVI